jgi:anti-sigma regulatory factor (Ser/Thr protein kinase)
MSVQAVRKTFPPMPEVLPDVRRFVTVEAERRSFTEFVQDLQLAVTEACSNAMRHSGTKEILVGVSLVGSCLEITVQDDGVYRPMPTESQDGQGHRGLHLMAAVVDDFSLRRGRPEKPGTTVRLVKCKT